MRFLRFSGFAKLNIVFGFFVLFAFFVYMGDAVMSYVIPVFLSTKISNPVLAGAIFAFSSVVGLLFNFLTGELFGSKNSYYFAKATIYASMVFPMAFIVAPNSVYMYLVGMAAWGIYYETAALVSIKFIELTRKKDEYSEAWGIISTTLSVAYFIGPLVATSLLEVDLVLNFYVALLFYFLAFCVFLVIHTTASNKRGINLPIKNVSPRIEFKRWTIFMKHIWPLWLFSLMLYLVEVFFWTIGVVYAESLKPESDLAGLILSVHVLPTILVGLILSRVKITSGKKKLTLVSGILAGIVLSAFARTNNVAQIIVLVAIYSIFSAIALSLLWATYEDFVSREKGYENDLIGLERSASSLAYIIGPLLAGILVSFVGEKSTMAYGGVGLLFAGFLTALVIPRKIRMPHKQIGEITTFPNRSSLQ